MGTHVSYIMYPEWKLTPSVWGLDAETKMITFLTSIVKPCVFLRPTKKVSDKKFKRKPESALPFSPVGPEKTKGEAGEEKTRGDLAAVCTQLFDCLSLSLCLCLSVCVPLSVSTPSLISSAQPFRQGVLIRP